MTTLLVILWVILSVLLVLHFSLRSVRTKQSRFELKRRGDEAVLRREKLFDALVASRQFGGLVIVVFATVLSVAIWNAGGAVVMIVTLIIILSASRVAFVTKAARRLYDPFEPRLLRLLEAYPLIGWLTGTISQMPHDQKIESVEHLQHLIETSGSVLSGEQRTIIEHGLHWHTTAIETVMTPVKDVYSIKHTELLGPLVLDDLHRSGHDRFPVIRGTVDTVIGMLDISQLLDISNDKKSETAEKAMSAQVLLIEADEPLPAALDMLQKSHLHMLVVVDADGKTLGIVTLADIAESLLGKNRGGVV